MLRENFVETLERSIRSNWDILSLADYQGASWKYSDVGREMLRLQQIFEAAGIGPGDKVAMIGRNSSNWAIAYLATVTYDAVIVPILADFTPSDVLNIVNHSDSIFLFAADNIYEGLDKSKLPNIRAVISLSNLMPVMGSCEDALRVKMEEASSAFIAGKDKVGAQDFILKKVPNDHLAVISYTSGTTGFSKGVMLNHNSLMANVRFAQNHMPLQPGDRIVSFLPLAHAYGVAFEFLFPFSIGCHITFLTKTPSPTILLQAFAEIRPRLVLSVPLIIEKIYKNQLLPVISQGPVSTLLKIPVLRLLVYRKIYRKLYNIFGGNFHEIVIGGAAFNPEAERFFHKIRFPFTVGYGMTECGPLISYASWKTTKLKAAGRPVDTLEVKIDSEDPEKIPGEIMVKGDNVMLGYYKNPEATAAVLTAEGWLHTGDLGVMDNERNIFIRGRSKSLILGASGQNIYPEEMEARINNLTYVLESVVVERNNRLIALVCPDKDKIAKDGISEEQWKEMMNENRRQINAQLPSYMQIAEFSRHEEEFEKTPKKSIKRFLYS